ncbi:hypothetical protein QZM64_41655 [Burkholderia cepacia]|uniref:hypothetical protein n=1 Tax=Burkholderia cepacia TaxID=292 RepID=UPI000B2ADCBF|nr:hypothetical protein [Burkholderia cepacia]MDN7445671.1 hypothetical protein [Burkholderia cepacia]
MRENRPKILVYKRTHTGDPNESGLFGCNDCMGQVRNWSFDHVIGIGGTSPWRGDEGIAKKVNWIGMGRKAYDITPNGHAIWAFEHFILLNENGPLLQSDYPLLYEHMLETNRRVIKSDSVFEDMFAELMTILHLASGAPPSPVLGKGKIATKQSHCPPQVPSTKCQKPKFSSCG